MTRLFLIFALSVFATHLSAVEPRQIQKERWQSFSRFQNREPRKPIVADQPRGHDLSHIPDPDPSFSLKLSMAPDHSFQIESSGPAMVQMPHWYLYARWCVNGIAVAVPEPQASARAYSGPGPDHVTSFSVGFGLPDDLGDVKVGDEIELEVLYVPNVWTSAVFRGRRPATAPSTAPSDVEARSRDAIYPLLSNRLKFVLDEKMMAEKDHPQDPYDPTKPSSRTVPLKELIERIDKKPATTRSSAWPAH